MQFAEGAAKLHILNRSGKYGGSMFTGDHAMKVNDVFSYDNSNIRGSLRVGDGATALNCKAGDIIEGTVSHLGQDVKVLFPASDGAKDKELSFPKDSLKNAYVGETRRFQVMGTENDKLVLKDLGGIANEVQTRANMHTTVDNQLVPMVNDFAETNGSKEKEDDSNIERLTEEDYSELRKEGFSIEDFKAERLSHAITRIKMNRAAKRNSIDAQTQELADERKAVRERAAKAVSAKYAASQEIIDRLVDSDLPVTDSNIASIIGAIGMSTSTAMLTDNSFAYMIKNELTPSVKNIYTSVYSGIVKKGKLDDGSWDQLKPAAMGIVSEANGILGEEAIAKRMTDMPQEARDTTQRRSSLQLSNSRSQELVALVQQNENEINNLRETDGKTETDSAELAPATEEDARWLIEYDIPLNKENLVYKKELEELKVNGRKESDVAAAAAKAMARGEKAEDAVLIGSHDTEAQKPERTIEELTSMLRLQEIRLSMIVESRTPARIDGLTIDTAALSREIDDLRDQVKAYYTALAEEIGIPETDVGSAMRVSSAIEDIAAAPLSVYAQTFTIRTQITLSDLSDTAVALRMQQIGTQSSLTGSGTQSFVTAQSSITMQNAADVRNIANMTIRALGSYEASATEIRADLGDSIRKAFGNVDNLIEEAGLEATDANRRAVRILGYNSMEITAQNITEMKYYDAKITSMIDGMKPSVVMSMIKRGFNPLDQDVDSINNEIRSIMDEEGYSAEEKFSSFLVKMESSGQIDDITRDAYIGIYRLLYQIEKNDGAAIGAALNSGRKLTLANLLTEARTRRTGVDASVDDESRVRHANYTNSISDQILDAFSQIGRNGLPVNTEADAANEAESSANGRQLEDLAGMIAENRENAGLSDATGYNTRLVHQALEVTEPEAWQEALSGENYGELTLEQVTEKLQNADKHYDSAAELAAAVRTMLGSGVAGRRFLKNIGIDDSKKNSDVFNSDPALELASKDELIEAMDGPERLQQVFDSAREQAERNAELEFIGGISILTRGIRIDEQLARYDLLGQMAGHEHYRLNIENNGSPARINLTVIHNAGNAGTVSMEVSTADYSLKADLSLTIFNSDTGAAGSGRTGRIDGRISTDSRTELDAIAAPLEGFITAMAREGLDTSGISTGAGRISPERYMDRIGELKSRNEGNAATPRLYTLAKSFLSFFL
ncbi:MAG: DUF6240 domain-containing protein [Lachnospiraceae bacterium]|nr:DUF6240 domain-containing protein [Lachnospiraceae bacterium]